MTSPAEALIHELRNALVPLDFKLSRGTATLEDAAAVVKRLFEFADSIEADLRQDNDACPVADLLDVALKERRELREGGCYDSDDFCDGYERGLEKALKIVRQPTAG